MRENQNYISSGDALSRDCRRVLDGIRPIDQALGPASQRKIDNKTKPLGALGKLEDLAVQLSLIQNCLDPEVGRKSLLVFAGDHGIAEEGISAYPSEVTGQMVKNFLDGGAAINVLCRHHGINIHIVDMGVNADFPDHPGLFKKKIRRGTRNFAVEEAMTGEEAVRAIESGMDAFTATHLSENMDIIGLGEMGIGNTTSASAIISTVTGITPAEATGRGTGVDDKGMEHKIEVIENALKEGVFSKRSSNASVPPGSIRRLPIPPSQPLSIVADVGLKFPRWIVTLSSRASSRIPQSLGQFMVILTMSAFVLPELIILKINPLVSELMNGVPAVTTQPA